MKRLLSRKKRSKTGDTRHTKINYIIEKSCLKISDYMRRYIAKLTCQLVKMRSPGDREKKNHEIHN
jgi:hypothetical protein